MATVGIWSVKNNLSYVIDYASDKSKTNEIYQDLHKEIDYIENDMKTEKKLLVSTLNCDLESVYEEMIYTKKKFNKTGGIIAFHSYQSFVEGETTPKEAHSIGVQLAEEMWGDRFQVVVATHLNTNHLHNHFVINSVSFVDGKRYYDTRETYAELRRLNDYICMEHNLSHMEEKKTKSGINYANYQKKSNNSNYSKQTKMDVDLAIALSSSYSEFLTILENMNYEITIRANKISVRNMNYKRNIRIERQFGSDYTIENINKQILGVYLPENNKTYSNYFKRDNTIDFLFKMNLKGLAKNYIRYLKLLDKYPKYIKKHKVSYELQQDIYKMEEISKETILLVDNKIETKEDFENYYQSIEQQLTEKKIDNCDLVEKKKTCDRIRKRCSKVEEIVNEVEKEVKINELE